MKAKTLGLIVTFSALAITLNPAISGFGLPFPLLPSMILQIWEIPMVAAFLLFGPKVGFSVAGVNSIFLLSIYPGSSRPWYWLGSFLSVSSMMLGVLLAQKLLTRKQDTTATLERPNSRKKIMVTSLALGMLLRVVVMAPYMFAVLALLTSPPIATVRIFTYVLPLQAIYNVVVCLYMIPTGYLIAKLISDNLRVGNRIL